MSIKANAISSIPFSVIIGENELAEGKVTLKENGLREGHPQKSGVSVNMSDLVSEVKRRLEQKAKMDSMIIKGEGLRVVDGIRGEPEAPAPAVVEAAVPVAEEAKPVDIDVKPAEEEKPAEVAKAEEVIPQ